MKPKSNACTGFCGILNEFGHSCLVMSVRPNARRSLVLWYTDWPQRRSVTLPSFCRPSLSHRWVGTRHEPSGSIHGAELQQKFKLYFTLLLQLDMQQFSTCTTYITHLRTKTHVFTSTASLRKTRGRRGQWPFFRWPHVVLHSPVIRLYGLSVPS